MSELQKKKLASFFEVNEMLAFVVFKTSSKGSLPSGKQSQRVLMHELCSGFY
ncbi:hypothetical protein SAMN06265375_101849 [Muriicola jejuensis]|nr:hypothetical protein SAMN06265375_101849 [Muriicola jejuensis]